MAVREGDLAAIERQVLAILDVGPPRRRLGRILVLVLVFFAAVALGLFIAARLHPPQDASPVARPQPAGTAPSVDRYGQLTVPDPSAPPEQVEDPRPARSAPIIAAVDETPAASDGPAVQDDPSVEAERPVRPAARTELAAAPVRARSMPATARRSRPRVMPFEGAAVPSPMRQDVPAAVEMQRQQDTRLETVDELRFLRLR